MSSFITTEEDIYAYEDELNDGSVHMAAVFFLELPVNLVKDVQRIKEALLKRYYGHCSIYAEGDNLIFEVDRSGYPSIETIEDLADEIREIKITCAYILRVHPSKIRITQQVIELEE
ncbi:hypothetical protein M5X11_08055 [Paenibacillus alginolyticus]|uniref:hypothetical protein n=1 Tax=Paenibacillus alginolyticus TaxID=59839 RepID=UPI00040DCD64|nr:hypothetical protein [Paenibacillus alginolyticus]MCY9664910.1 hypothetical protein [Paenibacillus alginolyticus]